MVNNHVDPFTGDVINPANIINMFAANLNNLPHNQNIQITFDTTNQLNTITPAHLNFLVHSLLLLIYSQDIQCIY